MAKLIALTAEPNPAPPAAMPDFSTLVRKHQAMVFSIAWNYLNDRGRAEELAQDVFVQLYRHLDEIESESHAVNWLRRTAVHRAIDSGRRRRPQVALDDIGEQPATSAKPSDPMLTAKLKRLVASLPEDKRALVVLRYQEELEPEEIARLMEIPVGTVKSNLRRALDLLKEKATRTFGENFR